MASADTFAADVKTITTAHAEFTKKAFQGRLFAALLMLSSDARKMLQFVRDCEHLSHDEVIERCIAERSTGTRKRHGRQATPWECCCPMSSAIPRPTVDWSMRSWRIFSDTGA
jgi:hypothetical protein